ncbi:MAG: hypothetical protein R3182_12125, partial [Draconibacterium sp.]|nr:hypothetical protein [Draconibacterium sp.]
MKYLLTSLFLLLLLISNAQIEIDINPDTFIPSFRIEEETYISTPEEGLWSIATDWEKDWPTNWIHASPSEIIKSGEWQILTGKLELPEGHFELRDAYRKEGKRIKCIRRFEWKGEQTLNQATLSIRWKIDANKPKAFLPGILYYGNPSGEKNGVNKVPVYHGEAGEKAIFEEHRYPMPFASFEWNKNGNYKGAALHSKPSPVYGGNHFDQWWSLGVESYENHSELVLLSGPITYNGKPSVAKALQRAYLPYGDTWTKIEPGTIIEKTFYLEAYDVKEKGSGFQTPVYTSIDIFKPFFVENFPTFNEIIKEKYRFTKSRYMDTEEYSGFNMYPDFREKQIVLGWAGQSEAPVYALQVLQEKLGDEEIPEMVQKSADHICTSHFGETGFMVRYGTERKEWYRTDPVSEGQAMNSIALAIKYGRNNPSIDTEKWELFLQKACDLHLKRINNKNWNPRNTAESFYVSPFLIASEIYQNEDYKKLALKIADYYAKRHLSMDEPYWGGTLDATCEDKEGAWGAFQGFMTAYEYTKNQKY